MQKWKMITQLSALIIFILLTFTGKMALWMLVTIAGILITPLFGRLFCGWICPVNTLTGYTERIKSKLGLSRREVSARIRWVGYLLLLATLIMIVVSKRTGRELPLWPILMICGVIVTAVFQAKIWHKLLCPVGLILKLPAKISLWQVQSTQLCKGCKGACVELCPGGALEKKGEGIQVIKSDCLLCFQCFDSCKHKEMRYQRGIDREVKIS